MEIDLYLPSFRTMRKRSRSRSPTPCEHDRPLKRSSAPTTLVVGDSAREPPPSFTPLQSTSPSSPVQRQTLSTAFLFIPGPAQAAFTPSTDVDGCIQDEWVALTRNLTLLPAPCPTEHEIVVNGSGEETMMNLDEPPQLSTLLYPHSQVFQHGVHESPWSYIDRMAPQLLNHHTDVPTLGPPSSRVATPALLRAPSPPAMPTPPLSPFPSHSPFIGAARIGSPHSVDRGHNNHSSHNRVPRVAPGLRWAQDLTVTSVGWACQAIMLISTNLHQSG
ncbi:hypothetical protein BJV74DRAFT_985727 [Russula compacta]|nr:hypothetical protein BJV74DRAFT_985727 [Russula compacta]